MKLSQATQKFILHWGEMGTRWGVNRTIAQIHALLYILPQPLNAEDIADCLSLARSNVSASLKELQGWGIVRIVHRMGDRRDNFESVKNAWQMFQIVLDQRKKREIDPTIRVIQESIDELKDRSDAYAKDKLVEMLEFFTTTTNFYEEVRKLPTGTLHRLIRLGGKIQGLLGRSSVK